MNRELSAAATGNGQAGHKVRTITEYRDEAEVPLSSHGRRGRERAQRRWPAITDARNRRHHSGLLHRVLGRSRSVPVVRVRQVESISGAGKQSWIYLDTIDEMLKQHPEIAPLFVASALMVSE